MLIRFTVENFLSFHERIDFNMLASPEAAHPHHVVTSGEGGLGILRTSLIYGANASGKSNLIRAMHFARKFIVDGVEKNEAIPVIPFKLDPTCAHKPSRFEFEFRFADRQFAYGFVIDRVVVQEEWLFEITPQCDRPLFERQKNSLSFHFEHDLLENIAVEERQRLGYEAHSTRENLLFLTNSKERNLGWFGFIYGWFQTFLRIVFPGVGSSSVLVFSRSEQQLFEECLRFFDVGIDRIDLEEFEIKNGASASAFEEDFKHAVSYGRNFTKSSRLAMFEEDSGNSNTFKFSTVRHDRDGKDVLFDVIEESDGTQRIIDIVPMLLALHKYPNIVYVIDEIESSLHPLLLRKLFNLFLNHQMFHKAESQLIASTHDVYLLDIKRLFRKDEIWFMEKNAQGESAMYSLANADVENLDLVNGYLNGRFGAIPFLKNINEIGW